MYDRVRYIIKGGEGGRCMRYLYEFVEHDHDMPFRLFVNSVEQVHFHWHKETEIIYVLQGSVTVYMEQGQYTFSEDDLIVVNSMSVHGLERTVEDNVLLTLQFSTELLGEHRLIDCNSLSQEAGNRERYDEIRKCLAHMAWESSKKSTGSRNFTLGRLQMMIGHLLTDFSKLPSERAREEGKTYDYKRLNRVLQYVDRHYSQKITLQTIAEQEHLSLHYFSHFFSAKIGIPFQKYLTSVRLEKAVEELKESSKSLTQIALDCGFANIKLFNKYFKEKYQCTPSAFRESEALRNQTVTARKPLTYDESPSGDYYEADTIQAMESLYRYLRLEKKEERLDQSGGTAQRHLQVHARVDEEGKVYAKHWNRVTTAGRAFEGLRADWQQQLVELQANLAFTHIRFHGIFNDEMMVYSESEAGDPRYCWTYVDKLYDFLLSVGVRPFVELGFMPTLLRRSSETIFLWRGNISPPADQNKWDKLVQAFIRHCMNRYGVEEVKKWYFEVWNEPDLSGVCWAGTREEYFRFYESTAHAIKRICPELRVGGPALGYGSIWNDAWAEQFMTYCRSRNAPIDFFSFHVYSEYPNGKEEKDKLTRIMPPTFYLDSVNRLREQIQADDHQRLELHMTEWNFSLYDRNLLHDTMFMGPFIVHQTLQTVGTMTSIAYWSFTDVFEESQIPSSPFYGGFGLINREGLKKPAYYALLLLSKLGEYVLEQGDGYVLTKRKNGSLQLLMYNYTHVDQLFASGDWSGLSETSRYTVFEERGDLSFHLKLEGMAGPYKLTSYRLDRDNGSVFDEWLRLGAPTSLTEEELHYLRGKSGPAMRTEWISETLDFEQTVVVPPHGLMLVTFESQY